MTRVGAEISASLPPISKASSALMVEIMSDGFHPRLISSGPASHKSPRRSADPAIRLHDLRHTCAMILLMASKHPKYVQELLGHSSISITLDTYSHVIEGMDGGLAEAMDEAL